MRNRTPSLKRLAVTLAIATLATAGIALAAPHNGDRFELAQPDGEQVPVLVWGDEYYQHVESLDGYTLARDPATGVICYARLSADGLALVSTGVRGGDPAVATLNLPRHLDIPPASRRQQAQAARLRLDAELAEFANKGTRDVQPAWVGNVQGITLIIDFSDQPESVPAANFAAYLNQEGYTGYGNNGSVRDYFYDVSDGLMTYTNFVPAAYFRASHPKTYYEDPSIPYGQRARELIREALIALNNSGFDFSLYDANHDGYVDALNAFYAGSPSGGWAVGLWPHSSVISYFADGVSTYRYQITNIGTSLALGTFCHENGHMLCFWPDLYDYDYDSAGVGRFCLMCNSGAANNPIEPCAPLKDLAGWSTSLTLLEGLMMGLPATAGVNEFYKVPHPTRPNEYYMIENRQRAARDISIADDGLAIWHVDTNGSNNYQDQTPALHYFCTLVQADGRWDLENNRNSGDSTDLWAAPAYVQFTPETSPAATWWSLDNAPIYIDDVSTSGATMTFNYRESFGSLAVLISVTPDGLLAPWRLEGPGGYLETGTGDRNLLVWTEGTYTLTWLTMPGWSSPTPDVVDGSVVSGGAPLAFTGGYTNPPFAAITAAPLGDTGPGRGASMVDFDGDGDLDIFVCNRGTANRLLRNDGNLAFTDVATGLLADGGQTMAAAWADLDNDGDQDVYLTRDNQANLLLEQDTAGAFTNIAQFGVDDPGAGRAAAWCDYDRDGRLDLYLVNNGSASQLFRSYGDIGMGHFVLFPQSFSALQTAGSGTAAPWADIDLDGDLDAYRVFSGQPNSLVENWAGTAFQPLGEMPDGNAGQAAAWGDVNGDGNLDLYLVNDGQPDVLYRDDGAHYTVVTGPALGDAGHGRGLAIADFDNDGRLDIYVARFNEPDLLIFGDGTAQFVSSQLIPAAQGATMAVACGDVNGDGGLDLYLSRDLEANVLLRNTIASRGHWLHIDLTGSTVNADAIGARVRLVTGGTSQVREVSAGGESLAQHARRVAFGLGAATYADSVIVRWPDGSTRVRTHVAADQVVTILQSASTPVPEPEQTPAATGLHPACPNPFNPSTTIAFDLAQAGPVEVSIYALDGRRVAALLRQELPAGQHRVVWDGRDEVGRTVASGAYVCRLRTPEGSLVQRLTLLK